MAHDAAIEKRLQEWAQWVTSGQRGAGYPSKSVLHESWSPPDPGSTPTPKISNGNEARNWATHRAIGRLQRRFRNTVIVCYCIRPLTLQQQAERLKVAPSTVYARLAMARRLVKMDLAEQESRAPVDDQGEQGFYEL